MKNDTRFLVDSSLATYFEFSEKSDPFLVFTSKQGNFKQGQKIVLPLSNNLINRIRAR